MNVFSSHTPVRYRLIAAPLLISVFFTSAVAAPMTDQAYEQLVQKRIEKVVAAWDVESRFAQNEDWAARLALLRFLKGDNDAAGDFARREGLPEGT